MSFSLSSLRRITSNGKYIPEVDGVRFLAISMVVLCHIRFYITERTTIPFASLNYWEGVLDKALEYGGAGVVVFFALSGYILSLPFASRWIKNGPSISLKKYYLRRVTRLEPPYFFVLLMSFCLLVWGIQKYSFHELLPHLGASMLYLHHWFYPLTHPYVLPVAWTLEVEVAFYLLMPLFSHVFRLGPLLRRVIMVGSILLIPVIFKDTFIYHHTFLLSNMPYFLAGMLLADLKTCNSPFFKNWPILLQLVPVALLIFIQVASGMAALLISPFVWLIFILLHMVLVQNRLKSFFANERIGIIGGMCYSIYLTHYIVISGTGRILNGLRITDRFLINFFVQGILYTAFILLIGALLYIFIERPAMKMDWHKKFFLRFKNNLLLANR